MNAPTCQPNLKAQQRSSFSFFKWAQRPRSEDKNEATLSCSRASWELPGGKTNKGLKSGSPLTSRSQPSHQMINNNDFSTKSEEFLRCHTAALVDPPGCIFCPSEFLQTVPDWQSFSPSQHWFWSPRSRITSSGTEPVSCSQGSQKYMFRFLLFLTISTKHKEPLKSGCSAAKLKLSDCATWNTSHQILAQNIILSRPTCKNLKTMTPKQREVDHECLGVWPKFPTTSGSPLLYIAQWTAGKIPCSTHGNKTDPPSMRYLFRMENPLLRSDQIGRTMVHVTGWSAAEPRL